MAKQPAKTTTKSEVPASSTPRIARNVSGMEAGNGAERVKTRLIALYGAPKCRKTTAVSGIQGAKWIISDSNCIPTLDALDRLPHGDDTYEVDSVEAARIIIEKMITAAEAKKFSLSAVVLDSITQFSDWLQQDVARDTNQSFLGENIKNNGWIQFNSQFSAFLDAIALLSRYVNVVAICHAKEKPDATRGDWNGLNLPPQMAQKLGRIANWVLYQSIRSYEAAAGTVSDEYVTVTEVNGKLRATEVVLHTQNLGLWIAGANAKSLGPEEPADLAQLMRKEGLL